MNSIKICNWSESESVVYNVEFGDMHLLSSFNAELLVLMLKQFKAPQLVEKIRVTYDVEKREAETYLTDLQLKYRKLNLID
jgi:hypothetical protein